MWKRVKFSIFLVNYPHNTCVAIWKEIFEARNKSMYTVAGTNKIENETLSFEITEVRYEKLWNGDTLIEDKILFSLGRVLHLKS